MGDQEARDRQLALLGAILKRTDLARGEIVVFMDMRLAVIKGFVLSDPQENWLREVNSRPMPDLAKVAKVEAVAPKPVSLRMAIEWMIVVVLVLFVSQKLLTFLLHWLGWR